MKITVKLSDRVKARHFDLESTADCYDIVRETVGKRFMSARLAERQMSRNDVETGRVYEVMIATGPTRNGSTPFANIRAYVSI